MLVDIAGREIRLEPTLRILVCIVVSEPLLLLYLIVLVVSNPDNDGRVVTQSPQVVFGLFFDRLKNLRPRRIVTAAEHKILPYHHTDLITGLVEALILVNAAAPNTIYVKRSQNTSNNRLDVPNHHLMADSH